MYRRLFLKYANTPLLATDTLVSNAVSLLLSEQKQNQFVEPKPLSINTKPEDDAFSSFQYFGMVEIRENIGIVNITGPIFRYGQVEACSTVYGTQHFAEAIARLEEKDYIEEIVLNFDTGGGEASGISELSEQIRALTKPTTAYIDGIGASAGYWLASACNRVVANKTALIGSIGVVFAFLDTSKMQEDLGVETIEIVSAVSPSKRVDLKSDDGRAKIQVLADDLADIFVSSIATYRDVTVGYVKENFGKGDVMIASKALDAKMIDELGTFEALITKLQGDSMPDPKLKGAGASTPATETKTTETQAVTAEEFKTMNPTAYQEILTAGATAERERIQAIANIDAPHYQAVIQEHMFNGTSTVKDVKVALFDAKEDKLTNAQISFAKGGAEAAAALKNISTAHTDGGGQVGTAEASVTASVKKATKKRGK